jgi:antitoxin component YwqK of YwqJK toxin-antitoxin module
MFKYLIVFVSCLFFSFSGCAQQSINQKDSNGMKTGVWMKKYTNGNIRYTGQFIDDKEVGIFKFYSEFYSTNPLIVKTYTNNSAFCKVQYFTQTGNKESVGEMNGKMRTGQWTYYDRAGESVVLKENYKNNKLSGKKIIFYPDGSLTEVSHYKQGKLHGERLRYTDQGKLIAKVPYRNGKIHGKIFYYHNTGVIRETGFYDDGKRVGRWEFYIDGVLAGVDEPNKKREKESVSLEEIQKRKELKNITNEIPKRVFTLDEINKRKERKNPTKKEIPKKTYTLEELEERKSKRVTQETTYKKDTISLQELEARKKIKNPPKKIIPKKTYTLEELNERKEKRKPIKKEYKKDTMTLIELEKRKS